MADATTHVTAHATAAAQSRPAVIIAGMLYLIAAYQRSPCPCLAGCIVRHLECLTRHEGADPVIRQICHAIRDTWALAANAAPSVAGARGDYGFH